MRSRGRKGAIALWTKQLLVSGTKQPKADAPEARAKVRQALHDWQRDPDLAGLRDPEALKQLPAAEQKACRQLWADVKLLELYNDLDLLGKHPRFVEFLEKHGTGRHPGVTDPR